jgi:hypothetical protein
MVSVIMNGIFFPTIQIHCKCWQTLFHVKKQTNSRTLSRPQLVAAPCHAKEKCHKNVLILSYRDSVTILFASGFHVSPSPKPLI